MLPKFYQDIACFTCNSKTLNHCYSPFWDGYKALPGPPFSKSDHDSILLLPSFTQKLKQEVTVLKSIQHLSDQWESMLQDCFEHADWDMFRVESENNIDVNTLTLFHYLNRPKPKTMGRWQHSHKTEIVNHRI
jgi:hypothetical protein